MHIDDCIKGTKLVIGSEFAEPLKLGSDQLITINRLIDIVEAIAGIKLRRRYDLDAPQGVRGRNSDNTLIQSVIGWDPA
jgi:GDP-D-mannose 3', 5'-epimerase